MRKRYKKNTNLLISSFVKLLSKGIWKVVFIYFILVCFSLCKYSSMLCILRLLSKSVWIHSIIFLLLNHHYINWYHINQGLCYGHIDNVVTLHLQPKLIKYYWLWVGGNQFYGGFINRGLCSMPMHLSNCELRSIFALQTRRHEKER